MHLRLKSEANVARGFLDFGATPASFRARERGVLKRVALSGRVDRSMADRKPPEDALSDLRRRVDAARGEGGSRSSRPQSAASLALRFGGEFGAAIIVGALLGYGVDYFLNTGGWGLGVGFLLGFAAGVANVVRVARSFNQANPPDPNASSIPDDDD
jgi:ATP synthase protein I